MRLCLLLLVLLAAAAHAQPQVPLRLPGLGAPLADHAVRERLQQYCGPIDVLGTAFDACYNPIKDAGGKIIGVSYIGHKK